MRPTGRAGRKLGHGDPGLSAEPTAYHRMEGLFVHRLASPTVLHFGKTNKFVLLSAFAPTAIESPPDFLLSKDKRYSGDNRLITPKSSYRRGGLAPRCRLCSPLRYRKPNRWLSSHPGAGEGPKGCSLHLIDFSGVRSLRYGCSPIKVACELGSERRETVRSLSVVGV